jgi:UPF0271 protein
LAKSIDLNADLGETVDGVPTADDEALFSVISSANVACGAHAGDDESMATAVARADRFGVAIGAHPSFLDRANFGRVALEVAPKVLREQVRDQILRLAGYGATVRYVKPHGALYHVVIKDSDAADAVASAVADASAHFGRALPILGMVGAITHSARALGLEFILEAFLDRGYTRDGLLVARDQPGALLNDPDLVAARAIRLVTEGVVEAIDGTLVPSQARSLCLHADSPGASLMANSVREVLDANGIGVRPPW